MVSWSFPWLFSDLPLALETLYVSEQAGGSVTDTPATAGARWYIRCIGITQQAAVVSADTDDHSPLAFILVAFSGPATELRVLA
jgi:hypothetical protein